jgi:integrase
MDAKMPKLPAYVFRRPNGSYRYKRNVPKKLREVVGKATLYRQLGESYAEAMRKLPKVHAEIEALFQIEQHTPMSERALAVIRGALGDEVADMVVAGHIAEYSPEDYALNELARAIEGKVPEDVVQQVYKGQLTEEPMTLTKALEEYTRYKSGEGVSDKDVSKRITKLRKDLRDAIGARKLKHVPLADITRVDANAFRDHLLERMLPNSVVRNVAVVKAAVNYVLSEHSLNIPNVFNGLKIKGAGASKDDRHPLTEADIAVAEPCFMGDPIAWALFATLVDTGARVSEVAGLIVQDVDLQGRSLRISPNTVRGLKTKGSDRVIPLSPRALELLQGFRQDKEDTDPLFSRYARKRGNDACSAMLMKRLRTVITDKKLTIHSLRHRMKDKLRNTGCPEDVSLAILGHSTNTVAANYGSGYALEVMREHMEKVWQ